MIVDLPLSMVIFHSYASLPEGNQCNHNSILLVDAISSQFRVSKHKHIQVLLMTSPDEPCMEYLATFTP